MKRGFNELVGLQVTMSRVIPRYQLTHHYRWYCDGKVTEKGILRGYDMHRHIPTDEVLHCLRDAYAPAILSIWQRVTKASIAEYYQFQVGATPTEMKFEGKWRHWAQL
jgi:hypothetical protein